MRIIQLTLFFPKKYRIIVYNDKIFIIYLLNNKNVSKSRAQIIKLIKDFSYLTIEYY